MHWIYNSRLTSSSTKGTFYRSPTLNKYSALWISMQCFGNNDDTSSRPTPSWGRSVWFHTETFSMLTFIKVNIKTKVILDIWTQLNSNKIARLLHFTHWTMDMILNETELGVWLKPRPNDPTFQHNISQYCWATHVACVWPPCCDMLQL